MLQAAGRSDLGGINEYERAVRYNHSKQELTVLVDCLSMTKSLAATLVKAEPILAPFLRLAVHASVQQLLQEDVVPVLHRVDKSSQRLTLLRSLLDMRKVVVDWLDPTGAHDDYKV